MLSALRINWVILQTSIHERLLYRGDFAFATLVRFLPIITQIFLWSAIFGMSTGTARGRLHDYTFRDMIAYYLLANLARAFSSMPGLAGSMAREIRDGSVKKYLTQPVDMLGYFFYSRVAHKLVYYMVATAPFALVFYLCRGYFEHSPTGLEIATFCLSLVGAFLIGFLLESLIGMLGFWLLEVGSLSFIFMMVNYFLSGHMIPLNWLFDGMPGWVVATIEYSPFPYLAYFPATVMLHRHTPAALQMHLAVEAGWVIALWAANRLTFHFGVRRYSAFGG